MGRFATMNHATVLVGDQTTQVLANDVNRHYCLLINDSALDQYLTLDGEDAVAHTGIVLKANGGFYEMAEKTGNLSFDVINAITSADAGVHATGTLTFTSDAVDGDTVTIGDDVYEFDTNGVFTPGNIQVDVSAGATASAAVTALVAAITASTTEDVSAADGALDTVVVTSVHSGVAGNAIATTQTCTNATWGATKLASGTDNTNYLLVTYR